MQTKFLGQGPIEKKSNPSPVYIGQSIYIAEEKRYGIFVGYNQDTDYTNSIWVFHEGEEEGEFDQFAYEPEVISYILMPDKSNVSGTRIYYGPFRKPTFIGYLGDKFIEDNQKALIAELKGLAKAEKKNNEKHDE